MGFLVALKAVMGMRAPLPQRKTSSNIFMADCQNYISTAASGRAQDLLGALPRIYFFPGEMPFARAFLPAPLLRSGPHAGMAKGTFQGNQESTSRLTLGPGRAWVAELCY